MSKRRAIIILCILSVFFVCVPLFVILRTINFEFGWKGLHWGSSEYQVKEWVEKNNNKANWAKCNHPHFGVSCYKVTWKEARAIPFEYIEFQFKNEKLVAVIETYHEEEVDPADYLKLYRSNIIREGGTDLQVEFTREKGIRIKNVDRVFYYTIPRSFNKTRIRHAVERLVKINTQDQTETISLYNLTTGYYSYEYFEEAKALQESFPSHRFNMKQ